MPGVQHFTAVRCHLAEMCGMATAAMSHAELSVWATNRF